MNTPRATWSLLLMFLPAGPATAQIVFDDGQEHVLTENAGRVIVTNESKLDLQAEVGGTQVDNATLVLNGGEIKTPFGEWPLDIHNGSNVLLKSGRVVCGGCSSLYSSDSNVQIDGALLYQGASFRGASAVVVSAGEVHGLDEAAIDASGTTDVTISGGRIQGLTGLFLSDSAILRLSGGVVNGGYAIGIVARDESVIEMSGGTVLASDLSGVSLSGTSLLNITGGEIECDRCRSYVSALQDSCVTIYGGDFNYPLLTPIQDTEGTMTGTLADGTSIDWSFQRDATATIMLLPYVAGDYNGDGTLDVADIDQQTVAMGDPDPDLSTYDENADGSVDAGDRLIWVHDHAGTWLGDADLDLEFNSSDMVQVFATGKYETDERAGWSEGDWDGTGFFDSSDMVAAFVDGGYEKGPKMPAAAVPEPTSILLLMTGLTGVAICRRRLRA